MYILNLTIVLLSVISIPCVDSYTYNEVDTLFTDVLKGYNKYIRPVLNQADLLQVNVSYDIGAIQDLDEIEGTVKLYFAFLFSWIDEKLSWDPLLYNYTYTIVLPCDSVWIPEAVLANPASSVISVDSSMTTVRYYMFGDKAQALWFPGGVLTASCTINIKYYPFDTQNCVMYFMFSNYFSTELAINVVNPEAPLNYFTANGEWDLIKTEALVEDLGTQRYTVSLRLARRPTFVVFIVILPTILLCILNIMVFLLPADSGERMSFAITLLLSLVVFLTIISDNIPQTSSPVSILSYFIGLQVLLSTMICFATIVSLRLYYRDENEIVPLWICKCMQICKRRQQNPNQTQNSSLMTLDKNSTSNDRDIVKSHADATDINGWKFVKSSGDSLSDTGQTPTGQSRVTWKVISGFVDTIMFVSSIAYFVIVLLVFIIITAARED